MKSTGRLLGETRVEESIRDFTYDFGLSVLFMCATARNFTEAIQAFVRINLLEHFGINRFAVYKFGVSGESLEFVLGVGEDPSEINREQIASFLKTNDTDNRHHPSPNKGYDLMLRVGEYLFFFDDTSQARQFDSSDISVLRRFSMAAERLLVIARERVNAIDTLTKLPGRVVGETMVVNLLNQIGQIYLGFVAIDNLPEIRKQYGYTIADLVFANTAFYVQEMALAQRGMAVRLSETEIMFACEVGEAVETSIKRLPEHILTSPYKVEIPIINFSISVGYTFLSSGENEKSISDAKRRADYALRAAGKAGGNQAVKA